MPYTIHPPFLLGNISTRWGGRWCCKYATHFSVRYVRCYIYVCSSDQFVSFRSIQMAMYMLTSLDPRIVKYLVWTTLDLDLLQPLPVDITQSKGLYLRGVLFGDFIEGRSEKHRRCHSLRFHVMNMWKICLGYPKAQQSSTTLSSLNPKSFGLLVALIRLIVYILKQKHLNHTACFSSARAMNSRRKDSDICAVRTSGRRISPCVLL